MANLFCDIRQENFMFFSVYFVFNPQITKGREGNYHPPCVSFNAIFFLAVSSETLPCTSQLFISTRSGAKISKQFCSLMILNIKK